MYRFSCSNNYWILYELFFYINVYQMSFSIYFVSEPLKSFKTFSWDSLIKCQMQQLLDPLI